MQDAVSLVNNNNRGLQLTIKSRGGFARCRFTDQDGSKRRFDVDANLIMPVPAQHAVGHERLGKIIFCVRFETTRVIGSSSPTPTP